MRAIAPAMLALMIFAGCSPSGTTTSASTNTTATTAETPIDHAVACMAYLNLQADAVQHGRGQGDQLALLEASGAYHRFALQTRPVDEVNQYYASSQAASSDTPAAELETRATQCLTLAPHDNTAEDPTRATVLAGLSTSVARDLGQPVSFEVQTLRVDGDWAWVEALPKTPSGGAFDFSHTHYAARAASGDLDGGGVVAALLQHRNGAWVVRNSTLGAQSVEYLDWPRRYGAPGTLMGIQPTP